MPHKMYPFFGLFYRHRAIEGKDSIMRAHCETTGDHICSIPADPRPLYPVDIDYIRCEMIDYTDDNGSEYKPMINNYMSYYYPSYLSVITFTEE